MPNTLGQLLLYDAIPEDMRDDSRVFNTGASNRFFTELAEKHPEKYADILHSLNGISRIAGTEEGGMASIRLQDLGLPAKVKEYRNNLRGRITAIQQDPRTTSEVKNDSIVKLMRAEMPKIQSMINEETSKGDNTLGESIKQGFRGNPVQLTQLLFGDMLVADQKGRAIPVPGLNGYGEGLSPMQYFAGAFGSRKGFSEVQFMTAKAGFLGKQIALSASRLQVTEEDCGAASQGILISGDNSDILGRVLARDVAGIPAGTTVDKSHLPKLRKEKILSRSLATCQTSNGVCQKCSGKRNKGRFPEVGAYVGIDTGRLMSEPITQAGLCLTGDTQVRMADYSVKLIKDILPGEFVLGADIDRNTYPVEVKHLHKNGAKEVYRTTFRYGSSKKVHLDSTLDHIVVGATRDAQGKESNKLNGVIREIPIGTKSRNMIAVLEDGYKVRRISQEYLGVQDTYDLEVDSPSHLYVLANGIVTHNSSKHSGGIIKGKQFEDEIGGFDEINQFVQVPKAFRGASVLAPQDAVVQNIVDAEQGGKYVMVGGEQLYVPRGREVLVKKGDKVEAGDMLTDGTPNPAEMVKHKGIGEARVYFINKFGSILKDNGVNVQQRHVETLSRAFFDRIKITDPDGVAGYSIDDVVTYSDMQREYKPRLDAEDRKPGTSVGMYLEKPTLHYTIGTRVTPKVVDFMKEQKVDNISVHKNTPGFEPHAVRMMDIPGTDPDFKNKLTGFGLKKSLMQDAQLGATSRHDAAGYAGKLMDPSRL